MATVEASLSPGERILVTALVMVGAAGTCTARAQTNLETPSITTAATVDGVPILVAEVEQRLTQLPRAQGPQQASRGKLAADALEALIQQQLVLDYLTQRSWGASDQEIDREMMRWKRRLEERELRPDDIYKRTGMDEPAMRRRFAWRVGWPRYLRRYLTEERLKEYYEPRRRDFDGTRLKVGHILWKLDDSTDDSKQTAIRQALQARSDIIDGKRSFEDAARQLSDGPSAADGGLLGWINRLGPMHEAFAVAAFRLAKEEISPPVVTPFGVHLIKCWEVQEGSKTWAEVRVEVHRAASREVFNSLASRARRGARIEYTGAVPLRE